MEPHITVKIKLIDAELDQLEAAKFTMSLREKINKRIGDKEALRNASTALVNYEEGIQVLESEKKKLEKELNSMIDEAKKNKTGSPESK